MKEILDQTIKERIQSRKFVVFMGLVIIATVALFTNFAEFSLWADYTKWMFGFYVAANAFVHGSRVIAVKNGNGK